MSDNFIKEYCDIIRLPVEEKEIKLNQADLSHWIEKVKHVYILDSSKDRILEQLLNLFEGKVGMPYSEEKLIEIKKSAEQRYTFSPRNLQYMNQFYRLYSDVEITHHLDAQILNIHFHRHEVI